MAPDITKAIRVFMNRVQLQGSEVMPFVQVMQALDAEDARVASEIAKAQAAGIPVVDAVAQRP